LLSEVYRRQQHPHQRRAIFGLSDHLDPGLQNLTGLPGVVATIGMHILGQSHGALDVGNLEKDLNVNLTLENRDDKVCLIKYMIDFCLYI
jgi:hypothetical protein